jgi:GT2 family glycosyltransferase
MMIQPRTLTDISVVIVTYRGDDLLKNCLDSLSAACGDSLELVIVDNSPSDATRALVERHPNARYVPSPGNPGFAGGNNRALPFCTRDYILLLNNDTVVHTRESIASLADFLDRHPHCAVAQGTMTLADGLLGGCGSFLTPFGFLLANGFNEPDAPRFHRAAPCFSAIGAFMMFRRSVLPRVGNFLFRTHFWSYYEETDFCHRVWLSGAQVWYVPTPPIDHLCGRTSSKFKRTEIMARYLRNQFFSLAVCLGRTGRLAMLPLFAGVVAGHAFLHLLRGDTAQFVASARMFRTLARQRKRIAAARRHVERMRRLPDRVIFRHVMKVPSLRYVLRAFKANA